MKSGLAGKTEADATSSGSTIHFENAHNNDTVSLAVIKSI